VHKPPSHRQPDFDFLPLTAPPKIEPAGRISGEGVLALKDSDPLRAKARVESYAPLTKIKSTQQERGEFFAARPAGSIFGNSGMSGSPSFGYFSWRDKKSD
jgi:hypothetical protein